MLHAKVSQRYDGNLAVEAAVAQYPDLSFLVTWHDHEMEQAAAENGFAGYIVGARIGGQILGWRTIASEDSPAEQLPAG